MRRWRLAVAVLLSGDLAVEADVLRRALGDPALEVVPPHLTLVPPVNVRAAELGAALRVVRAAAGAARPFAVGLGPVASFHPVTPTVHLAVSDAEGDLETLRAGVFQPPVWRDVDHPFVPHVTLRDGAPLHRVHAATQALGSYRAQLDVVRVTVLAEGRDAQRRRRWAPVADADLGGVRDVGRGGLPTELAAGTLADPDALRCSRPSPRSSAPRSSPPGERASSSASPGREASWRQSRRWPTW
ncbi:MAG: hypothetical protein GEV08_05200 [Acidimicrobiia bacterium]|nr:hypothetical protein [Acidimicrobiia bacterium]